MIVISLEPLFVKEGGELRVLLLKRKPSSVTAPQNGLTELHSPTFLQVFGWTVSLVSLMFWACLCVRSEDSVLEAKPPQEAAPSMLV